MSDLTRLRELTPLVRPRDLDDLRDVLRRRRRTTALVSLAAAGAAVAVVAAGATLGPRTAAPAPVAPEPTTSSTPARDPESTVTTPAEDTVRGPFPTLTPEEVRSHPAAVAERGDYPVTAAPGVAARLWTVCLADCSRDTTYQPGEVQRALEVTHDDFRTSVLYPYAPPDPNVSHVVDDWFALSSVEEATLVDTRGDVVPLTDGASVPVAGIAGPLVYAASGLAYVDLESYELHPLQGGYWDWWGAGDTWYWGSVTLTGEDGSVLRHALTWRNADGSFGARVLPVDFATHGLQVLQSRTPGTMGAIDPGGDRRLLHVSTDYGENWDVRVVPASWGTRTSLPDDWRSWVGVWPTWATP